MIKNKRGLSMVATTLILILLVLVAVGILWTVIKNLIQQGATEVDVQAQCLKIEVKATEVDCLTSSSCDIKLTREPGGETIDGVKLVFYEGTNSGNIINASGNIDIFSTKQISGVDSGLENPDKLEITVYFEKESGEEQLCQKSSQFSF